MQEALVAAAQLWEGLPLQHRKDSVGRRRWNLDSAHVDGGRDILELSKRCVQGRGEGAANLFCKGQRAND